MLVHVHKGNLRSFLLPLAKRTVCSILSTRRSQPEAITKQCRHAQLKPESCDFWDKNLIIPEDIIWRQYRWQGAKMTLGSRLKTWDKITSRLLIGSSLTCNSLDGVASINLLNFQKNIRLPIIQSFENLDRLPIKSELISAKQKNCIVFDKI